MARGLEAIAAFSADPNGFDIVVTDMTMLNIAGLDLARRILLIRPGMPVIRCTGYSEMITPKIGARAGIRQLLMKPVHSVDLTEAIRKALPGA